MQETIRPLAIQDAKAAAALDEKWFGDYSVSLEDAQGFIGETGENTLGVFTKNGDLLGFATFEIVENALPRDYVGRVAHVGKVLFLSNFTTTTNYNQHDWSADEALLQAIEQKARELRCSEIWEGLAQEHPYKKEINPEFDAYGFYESHGYIKDTPEGFAWEPSKELSIPCVLFRKPL